MQAPNFSIDNFLYLCASNHKSNIMDTEVMSEVMPDGKVHHGHNVRRFRLLFGYKQEAFAEKLNMTPSALCRYEQKETIDYEMLDKMAKELKLPIEALKDLSEEAAISFIANTFENMGTGVTGMGNGNTNHLESCTFEPVEKIAQLYAEKEQLYLEKIALCERLLKAEQDKVALLEKMNRQNKP